MSKKRKVKRSSPRKKPTKRISKPKPVKEGAYLGCEFESFCELSLLYFAEELIAAGYAERVERSPSYSLCDPVQSSFAVKLKRGSKQETQTISQGVTYTPDYDIYFTSKALGVFCWDIDSHTKWDKNLLVVQKITPANFVEAEKLQKNGDGFIYRACCEVKPDFQRNSTTPKSVQSMKWLYQKLGVYVNLFRPNRIFEGLFVPGKYMTTERGTQRILKFKPKTLQEYLKTKL